MPVHISDQTEPQPIESTTRPDDDDFDEDEIALAKAISASLSMRSPRWTAGGTNLEQLAIAIQNSKLETRGVYYKLPGSSC